MTFSGGVGFGWGVGCGFSLPGGLGGGFSLPWGLGGGFRVAWLSVAILVAELVALRFTGAVRGPAAASNCRWFFSGLSPM